ncbi:MAG: hypothetical protein A3C07_03210 [Candidatus Sungbacteria bacterium RIFCSPHIGHO2_02_FULL_47_11]|uniref:Uncharacterized protein n=1 Tax=Candidatus Sungbacteria bacterium RIFCSPHIGHO2_02_FULL_47_11 TaxID=1802270 RepID=A0A1G2KIU6_9BACT|nr:MAG: hypothetical protein A3C07_03210 [Candidatus Sungbacteria bacterium RIFCSPHIGHO2_02_FULL_47_11]
MHNFDLRSQKGFSNVANASCIFLYLAARSQRKIAFTATERTRYIKHNEDIVFFCDADFFLYFNLYST